MNDIVEHLRREASKQDMLACEDMLQAADKIDRLRALCGRLHSELDTMNNQHRHTAKMLAALARERDKLRAALTTVWNITSQPGVAAVAVAAIKQAEGK